MVANCVINVNIRDKPLTLEPNIFFVEYSNLLKSFVSCANLLIFQFLLIKQTKIDFAYLEIVFITLLNILFK
jgi:hypothetical protein